MVRETGIEIERRFLLKSMPKVGRYDYILQIQQHYLSKKGDRITERIRGAVHRGMILVSTTTHLRYPLKVNSLLRRMRLK